MRFPIFGKFSAHYQMPQLANVRKLAQVLFDQRVPFTLQFFTVTDCFSKMRECFFRYIKKLIFRPAQVTLGFGNSLGSRRIGMRLTCALGWHPKTDGGFY